MEPKFDSEGLMRALLVDLAIYVQQRAEPEFVATWSRNVKSRLRADVRSKAAAELIALCYAVEVLGVSAKEGIH